MGIFGDFTVLATSITIDSRLAGWRVTATNPAVRYSFECWYREGRIYDVAFGSPAPWNHQTSFVLGGRAKHIDYDTATAVLQAMRHWCES